MPILTPAVISELKALPDKQQREARLLVIVKDLLPELVEIYADARRFETGDNHENLLRYFSNYMFSLQKLIEGANGDGFGKAVQEFDANSATAMFGLSPDMAVEEIKARFNGRKEKRRSEELAQAEAEQNQQILGNIQTCNSAVKVCASRTAPHYLADKRIDNMVCVVRNVKTGATAEGRAGHGKGHDELQRLLKDKCGLKIPISKSPANSNCVGNTVNCAEWEALYNLLTQNAMENIRGADGNFSDLYFAAAVPGKHGGLIPPCDNCKRLMNYLYAKAFGYTPSKQTASIV